MPEGQNLLGGQEAWRLESNTETPKFPTNQLTSFTTFSAFERLIG
ncbi:hypothetical protein D1AOALGA4SA_6105 [Olavius algarvensis Delta 1 endosymbiont]|nr:hypothetical protein D1AOALGA4SA_6105 [Olavius algarvensis Delta 1 endosymbiont]